MQIHPGMIMNRNIMAFVLVIVFIVFGVFAYNFIENLRAEKNTTITIPRGYHALGVVDMNYDHSVNEEDLRLGEDAILALDPTWTGPISSVLSIYDADKDSLITQTDPAYSHLVLIFAHTQEIVPIATAGIRGIAVGFPDPVKGYRAVMADSSTRWVMTHPPQKKP